MMQKTIHILFLIFACLNFILIFPLIYISFEGKRLECRFNFAVPYQSTAYRNIIMKSKIHAKFILSFQNKISYQILST